ncbi:unnamed protein product [Rotaria sordida]|uniref:Uncharacterized protein n=1 Tax=Rotaria sordida TaxID=392033 RepID=A0A819T3Y6_9BILA|nr:unnamed protein product [Rotaria sordida]
MWPSGIAYGGYSGYPYGGYSGYPYGGYSGYPYGGYSGYPYGGYNLCDDYDDYDDYDEYDEYDEYNGYDENDEYDEYDGYPYGGYSAGITCLDFLSKQNILAMTLSYNYENDADLQLASNDVTKANMFFRHVSALETNPKEEKNNR